jgi:hypothetical protein
VHEAGAKRGAVQDAVTRNRPESTPMHPTRRAALRMSTAATLLILAPAAHGQAAGVRLFRVTTTRGEVTMGFTPADLARLGEGNEVERLARALAREGQITGWHYAVTRAPDGSTRFAARDRVAVMRQDGVSIQPYEAALPVAPPPAE